MHLIKAKILRSVALIEQGYTTVLGQKVLVLKPRFKRPLETSRFRGEQNNNNFHGNGCRRSAAD